MTTDPSNGRLPYDSVFAAVSYENGFLTTEETCAWRKHKREKRSDSVSRSQSAEGAAEKYLSASNLCKFMTRMSIRSTC